MASCNDCYHVEICDMPTITDGRKNASNCKKFKNKANVVEVKHGNWIFHNDGSGTCSVCGRHQKHIWDMCSWQKYCGHCGAKMDIKTT